MKYLDKVDLFLTVGYSDTVLYSPARSQTLYTSQRLVRYSKKQKKKILKGWHDEERGGHRWISNECVLCGLKDVSCEMFFLKAANTET